MPLEIDESDGFLQLNVATHKDDGSPGEPATVWLDTYAANNVYAQICDEHEESHARGEAFCAWLAAKYELDVSHGTAFRIAGAVAEAVLEFKKKYAVPDSSETPDSPSSTGTPSESSPPAT